MNHIPVCINLNNRKKQTKYEERIREIECYYQNEMESIRQNAKNQIAHLEQEKEKRMTEEEKMRDEVKGWKSVRTYMRSL